MGRSDCLGRGFDTPRFHLHHLHTNISGLEVLIAETHCVDWLHGLAYFDCGSLDFEVAVRLLHTLLIICYFGLAVFCDQLRLVALLACIGMDTIGARIGRQAAG